MSVRFNKREIIIPWFRVGEPDLDWSLISELLSRKS